MSEASAELKSLLLGWSELSDRSRDLMVRFYQAVLDENQIQNLTRVTDPPGFFHEHLSDVRFLSTLGVFSGRVLDLGSGNGVPGLPLAIVRSDLGVVLCDSEKKKADFLARTVEQLGLNHVSVTSARGELFLSKERVDVVMARAVGPISRLWNWLGECSTWNTLVLLKGPGWEEEWNSHDSKKARNALNIREVLPYQIGDRVTKDRKLVILDRKSKV